MCNQLECAKPVGESNDGCSEEHPEAVGNSISCSVAVTRKCLTSILIF